MSKTATLTLTDFLLARIAEDEEWARWGRLSDDPSDPDSATKILHWDHARLRAECEAKRRIVELHHPSYDTPGPEFEPYCEGCWEAGGMDGAPTHPCPTIRLVALPYADHPDYNPDWR